MKVFIIANGRQNDYDFAKKALAGATYILACDGGLRHCHNLEIVPDYIIGDMDSADGFLLNEYRNVPILRFLPEKDQTDLELALAHACDLGAKSIVVLGGLGGRLDHQLANIHVLAQAADRDVCAEIWDEHTKVHLIKSCCLLHKNDGILVTLLPLTTTAEGIVTHGLKYPLKDESLKAGYARGVSNEITEEHAKITLKSGLLLAIQIK